MSLESNPRLGKPLRGALTGKWSLRAGNYRLIYVIDEKENSVILYSIRHRKGAYR